MPTSTVENYLKELYLASQRADASAAQSAAGEPPQRIMVSTGLIATALGVTPGTATVMIKTLAESGLVDYEPRAGAALTSRGRQLALHVVRRHRLIELFLVQVLKLDWSEVHDEAEHLEHVISDKVLDRIDDMLGRPAFDPHGHPIPTAEGTIAPQTLHRLTEAANGSSIRVARFDDRDPAFLRYVDEQGLGVGATAAVIRNDALAQAITVKTSHQQPLTIGFAAAEKIFIESND